MIKESYYYCYHSKNYDASNETGILVQSVECIDYGACVRFL